MIYRKKPVEIEAWEFTKEALKSDDSWVRLYVDELHLYHNMQEKFSI